MPGDGDSWLTRLPPLGLPRCLADRSWWGFLGAECVIGQPPDVAPWQKVSWSQGQGRQRPTCKSLVQSRAYLEQERSETWLRGSYIANRYPPGYVFFKTNIPICLTDVQRALKTLQAVITQAISWVVKFDIVKPEALARYLPYSESLKFLKGVKVSSEIDSGNKVWIVSFLCGKYVVLESGPHLDLSSIILIMNVSRNEEASHKYG